MPVNSEYNFKRGDYLKNPLSGDHYYFLFSEGDYAAVAVLDGTGSPMLGTIQHFHASSLSKMTTEEMKEFLLSYVNSAKQDAISTIAYYKKQRDRVRVKIREQQTPQRTAFTKDEFLNLFES